MLVKTAISTAPGGLPNDQAPPAACHQPVGQVQLGAVMDALAAAIPRGSGPGGVWRLGGRAELEKVLVGGARYAVEQGHGTGRDLARCEDEGVVADAEPARVSQRAVDRGLRQVGSL